MADKYLDIGAYSLSCSFTATCSGSTLTVTAVSSGYLNIGSQITCPGVDDIFMITALGTGTGGTGTYTVSNSQTVGTATAMTAEMGYPLNTIPTALWGVAQDGDGTAPTPGTPSTASVVFTGVPSTGSIYVMGIALSPTWATNADTCANNLAAAINASTATALSPSSFTTLSQIKNHLYARGPSNGAAAGTCEIMTRQASASHAGLAIITHTLDNVSSSGTINLSGGSGGCWGFFSNTAGTLWPSAMAYLAYGIAANASPRVKAFCGSITDGDVLTLRTNRELWCPTRWGGSTIRLVPTASEYTPIIVRTDALQEVWTSDPTNSKFVVKHRIRSYQASSHGLYADTGCHVIADRNANGDYSLAINSGSTDGITKLSVNNGCMRGVSAHGWGGQGTSAEQSCNLLLQTGTGLRYYEDCHTRHSTNTDFVAVEYGSGNTVGVLIRDCVFDSTGATVANDGVLGSSQTYIDATMIDCVFKGFVSGSRLTPASGNTGYKVALIRGDLGNVSLRGPGRFDLALDATRKNSSVVAESMGPYKDFLMDYPHGCVEWNSEREFPTLSAKLPDGITGWSMRINPTTNSTNTKPEQPFELPEISKINLLDDGDRTLTLNMLVDTRMSSWDLTNLEFAVCYTNTSNEIVYVRTPRTGSFDTSTAAWSKTTFTDGGTLNYDKKEISLALTALKQGSVISVLGYMRGYVADNTYSIFLDPEFVLT